MKSAYGRLMNHLPSIYRQSKALESLLMLFEDFLFGGHDPASETDPGPDRILHAAGIEEKVDAIATLFDPRSSPDEFLPWLSQWVALSDYGGLSTTQRRRLIQGIVPLYALRGTKPYLERLLQLFTPDKTRIHIDDTPPGGFAVGKARVGIDTLLAPERPHWFKVRVALPGAEDAEGNHVRRTAMRQYLYRVIDLAKPVHTVFELEFTDDDYPQVA
jgi:phage tail-like protein